MCSLIAAFVRRNDAHGENRQTQVDGRRIDRIQLVPEAETVARRPLLATTQQTAEQRFVEGVGLLGVHPRERRAADRWHAQVIELGGLSAQIAHDVAQALPAGQLAQAEGDELRPAAHDAQALPALMVARLGVEFMSREATSEVARRLCYDGPWLGSPVF